MGRGRSAVSTSLKRERSSQAAAGGSLAARELGFDRIWRRSRLASTLGLVTHASGRISFGASARREAWLERLDLLFGDLPCRSPGMVLIPSGRFAASPVLLSSCAASSSHPRHPRTGEIHGRPQRRPEAAEETQEAEGYGQTEAAGPG